MNIYMTGGNGRVGKELREWGITPLICDVTDPLQIIDSVSSAKPTHIIHLAAISDVDWCEKPENGQAVIKTNLRGTYNLLDVAEKFKIKVVMLSSDHVFNGKWGWLRGYREDSTPHPINFYGQSKLAAESLTESYSNFKVVRTSYLFNRERLKGKELQSQPTFIHRSFMYLPHFALRLMQYLGKFDDMPTITHISGSKSVSWYRFMSEFEDVSPRDVEIPLEAPRPHYAGLKTKYKFFAPISYKEGIAEMLGSEL